MKQKKLPLRMCLGCQEMKPKRELTRIVKNKENEISVDATGKKQGRGAYVCKSVECFEKARKGKRLEKAFESKIGEDIYEILKQRLEDIDG
ncbi:MAG: YlxR family protein [Ruminiclostridium sp.]|nr:YlxR family protein [Ruminiclostridium sp.]